MSDVRATIELDPGLRRKFETAARVRDTSVQAWIEEAVRRELEHESATGDPFTRVSVPAFVRDWDSEDDAVYDEIDH
jgi:hypothetical protein